MQWSTRAAADISMLVRPAGVMGCFVVTCYLHTVCTSLTCVSMKCIARFACAARCTDIGCSDQAQQVHMGIGRQMYQADRAFFVIEDVQMGMMFKWR